MSRGTHVVGSVDSHHLNGNIARVLRWTATGVGIAGCYFGLKADIESARSEARSAASMNAAESDRRFDRVEYRLEAEYVTKEAMRRWIDELRFYNSRVPEPSATNGLGAPR